MIKEIHSAACPEECLTAAGLDPDRVIYFDIETTGFRPSTSQLYMIGWAVRARAGDGPAGNGLAENGCGNWTVTQFLAENASEEKLLLDLFTQQLCGYDTIVEFNGDRFDLPYLREKCSIHNMPDPFSGIRTVDLYQELKPCRTLLGLSRLNQKSVEQFLHITREDPYNGGELIDVYRRVRKDGCEGGEDSVRALFLHNYEDVLGMLAMTPVLSYPMIRCSCSPVTWRMTGHADARSTDSSSLQEEPERRLPADHLLQGHDAAGSEEPASLELSFRLELPVPADIDTDTGLFRLRVRGKTVTVCIPLIRRTLRHFFPNYKDYYYLPEEDMAVHRSIAGFVDPGHRTKATAQNCYVRKEGIFLPQPEETRRPSFRESVKDHISWFELTDAFLEDPGAVSEYTHSLLSLI